MCLCVCVDARYQGESNVECNDGAAQSKLPLDYYACLLPRMVDAWRQDFQRDFPFLVVELAAYGPADTTSAQRTAHGSLPRLRLDQHAMERGGATPSGSLPPVTTNAAGVASAIDLGDDGVLPYTPPSSRHGGIHPRNKTEVGRRLALAFAKLTHQPDVVATGPIAVKASASFDSVSSGTSDGASSITVAFDEATSSGMVFMPTQQCATHAKLPNGTACCDTPGGRPFEVCACLLAVGRVRLLLPLLTPECTSCASFCRSFYPMARLRSCMPLSPPPPRTPSPSISTRLSRSLHLRLVKSK